MAYGKGVVAGSDQDRILTTTGCQVSTDKMSDALTPERWRQVKAIFQVAVEHEPERRAEIIESNCSGDSELRAAVERLLAADAREPDFLEDSPIDLTSLITTETEEPFRDRRLGPYRILEEIGRGGMGAVYLAQREDEFEKRVAIKIIKRGMDTHDMLRRFRNERQILAHLDHPNIARLLDGGSTADGLPYFVMEYVDGLAIDEYCTTHDLAIPERLKLFRQVCAAVSYAHQHLAIHRDIKPSNILVTADGTPKLLDFGIAKLLAAAPDAPATATALPLMTPEYASPEQARGDAGISTASDVYSLGVVLYELLTGRRPYLFLNRRADSIAMVICETEPERPSAALADSGMRNAELKKNSIAEARTNPHSEIRNPKLLRGDLDNIILMALRKDPVRRYLSVDQFSEDLRRHLEGLPVSARADTFRYRAGKFVQRNKVASLAATLVVLTLGAGLTATLYQARRAERQRALAERRFNEVRELAHSVVFKYHDAIERLPGSTPVREMLVKDALSYLDRLSQDAAGDRSLQRELALAYLKVGDVQGKAYSANLGDTAGAIVSYRKALVLLETLARTAPPGEVQARLDLRDACLTLAMTLGIGGDRQTVEYVEKARAISEELAREHPEDTSNKLMLARSYVLQSDTTGRLTAAEHIELFRHAQIIVEELVKQSPANVECLASLGVIYSRLGDHLSRAAKVAAGKEARDLYQQAAQDHRLSKEAIQKLLDLDPDNNRYQRLMAIARDNYGEALLAAGETKAALVEIQAAAGYFEHNLITDPKNLNARYERALSREAYARALFAAGDQDVAVAEMTRATEVFASVVKDDPANNEYRTAAFHCAVELGDTLLAAGRLPEALRQYQSLRSHAQQARTGAEKSFLRVMHEKIGDFHLSLATRSGNTKSNAREQWLAARAAYQQALEGQSGGMISELTKKLDQCAKALK